MTIRVSRSSHLPRRLWLCFDRYRHLHISIGIPRPTPDFRRSQSPIRSLSIRPFTHPAILEQRFSNDVWVLDKSVLKVDPARSALVYLLSLDDT